MTKTLSKYRIYCVTDAQYEYTDYIDVTDGAPTVCPVNAAHTIDSNQTTATEVITNTALAREDGVIYSVPKPSSYGLEMCDRDFRINTCIYAGSSAFEDLKLNTTTLKEDNWNEMSLVGVYKDVAGTMTLCTDQTDCDSNGILTVFEYCAKLPADSSLILYEMRDGILYVDPDLAVDWNNLTESEKFGYRTYAVIAPDIPAALGGSIAVFDSYLGMAPNRTVEALSPQATVLDPSGPGGAAGVVLRLYFYHPAGSKLSHVMRLVMYRAPGTY